MATYRFTNTSADGVSLKLTERPVYGSSRLGSLRMEVELNQVATFDPTSAIPVQQIDLNYELTDHLGNVSAVVTGRLLDGNGGGTPKQAELLSAQGYEPFGSLLPGRNYSSNSYRFAFNGMENDNEMHGATGTSVDFGARNYDPRVGRWLATDPARSLTPYESPYMFAGDNPIYYVDPNGKWKVRWADNNDHSQGVVLEAEKGDNLEVLATQMGIPYQQLLDENFGGKDWSKGLDIQGGWLRAEDLPGVEIFKAVNEFLSKWESDPETNCAMEACSVSGIDLGVGDRRTFTYPSSDAEGNPIDKTIDLGPHDKNSRWAAYVNGLTKVLSQGEKSISEAAARTGDIITYGEVGVSYDRANPQGADHFSTVLLKDKTGSSIQTVFEKSGSTPAAISPYGVSGGMFEPSGASTGSSTPIHRPPGTP